MILPRLRITRVEAGQYSVGLPDEERDLLLSLMDQMRDLLTMDDPSTKRIFPTAYNEDPERDREYQALVHDDLLSSRLSAIETIEETVDAGTLSTEQLEEWMTALNSLRLVLGTRLDVSEELPELDPDDPDTPAYVVYDYLAWLLAQAVMARSDDL